MEQREVSRCKDKLSTPRSLRNNDDEAEMVWNAIAKRYPNAAPLLCEMESAIERAEELLDRLRSAPCNTGKEIERTSSDDSEQMLSAASGTSMSTYEEIDVADAGTRTSDDCVAIDREVEESESVDAISPLVPSNNIGNSANTNDTPVLQSIAQISQKNDIIDSKNLATIEIRKSGVSVNAKPVESLEEWDQFAGGNAAISKRLIVKKPVTIVPDSSARINDTDRFSEETTSTIPKAIGTSQSEESEKIDVQKKDRVMEPKRRTKSTPDPSPVRNSNQTSIPIRKKVEKMRNENGKMGSGDEKNSKSPTQAARTAVAILKEYAEQCNEEVNYRLLKHKSNFCEYECTFAGYKAVSIGNSKFAAQKAVATTILRSLVENEMDEGLKDLAPPSNERLREILSIVGELSENARRKLYKLCLEKNAPKPIYSVSQSVEYGLEGVKHSAVCKALNEVGVGHEIREKIAQMLAAEDLLTKLSSQHHQ